MHARNSHDHDLLLGMSHGSWNKHEEHMIARMTADGRVLGFDAGDWLMLIGGSALAGLLTFLVA